MTTNLIDALEQRTQLSIDHAAAYANPDWYQEAEAAVMILVRKGEDFTTDDVWHLLHHTGLKTPEPRAMGSIIRSFAKERFIRDAGYYRKSMRPECHRRPLAVWRPIRRAYREAV